MPSNLALSARLNAATSTAPGWLIAAQAEEAAAKYLTGGREHDPVCPDCFTTKAKNGACECD